MKERKTEITTERKKESEERHKERKKDRQKDRNNTEFEIDGSTIGVCATDR